MSHASYLEMVFIRKKQDKCIREIRELIKNKNLQFDGFVVTGVSGITMGSILSRLLRKELVVVRKNEGTHSSYKVENYKHNKRYIFLDDLIASGETYKRVIETLEYAANSAWLYGVKTKKSKIIGCIVYDGLNRITGNGVQYVGPRKLQRFT